MTLDTKYPAISDLRAAARRRIPHFVFEYLDSATGLEDQKRRNEEALEAVHFMPAILEGRMTQDLTTTLLGRDYPVPFGVAPVGMSGIMWPRCEKILAAACASAGIPYSMSNVATVVPETLAPFIGDQGWLQIYTPDKVDVRQDMLRRGREAGFHTLIITVDVPLDSRRERQRRANLTIPPRVNLGMLLSMALHPAWTLGTLREGIPSLRFCEDYAREGDFHSMAHAGHVIRGQPGWDTIEAMQKEWDGPILVKGVQKPQDAKRLISMGIDGIWISNHTGRQFDGGPACLDALPRVRDACPDAPIVFDSGIQGGLDILRAIALGADFVMLGRAWHYAVGALAERGPDHLIHILTEDMKSNMAQMGARSLGDLKSRLV